MRNLGKTFERIYETWLLLLSLVVLSSCAMAKEQVKEGKWKIAFNKQAKAVDIISNSYKMGDGVYVTYQWDGKEVSSRNYESHKVSVRKNQDLFGKGRVLEVVYTGNSLPKLTQSFYVYSDKDYILTEFTIEWKENECTNKMASVCVDSIQDFLPSGDNRVLFVPFDNDKWIRYQSHPNDWCDGLDAARTYTIKELWSGKTFTATGNMNITVPSKDVYLFEIK